MTCPTSCARAISLARTLHHRLGVTRALVLTVGLASTFLPPPVAWAAQFTSVWTETSPNAGLTGTADISLGAPDGPGFFQVSNFSVTVGTDICFTCAVGFTDDLSGVLFDTTTFLLKGDITGSFTGNGGHPHTFVLTLTDPPSGPGTWTFSNDRTDDQLPPEVSTGTYTPGTPVPEPGTLTLVATGMAAGIGSIVRSRQRKPWHADDQARPWPTGKPRGVSYAAVRLAELS